MNKVCVGFNFGPNYQEVGLRETTLEGKKYIEITQYDKTHWAVKVVKVVLAALCMLSLVALAFASVRKFCQHALSAQFKYQTALTPLDVDLNKYKPVSDKVGQAAKPNSLKALKSDQSKPVVKPKPNAQPIKSEDLHKKLALKPPVPSKLSETRDHMSIVRDFLTASDLRACSQTSAADHLFYCDALSSYHKAIKLIPSRKPYLRWSGHPPFGNSYSEPEQQGRFEELKKWLKLIPKGLINQFWGYRDGMIGDGASLLLWTIRFQNNPERRLHIVKELLARGANPAIPYNHPYGEPGDILAEARQTKDPALVAVLEKALQKKSSVVVS